jgi:hypothetical protein
MSSQNENVWWKTKITESDLRPEDLRFSLPGLIAAAVRRRVTEDRREDIVQELSCRCPENTDRMGGDTPAQLTKYLAWWITEALGRTDQVRIRKVSIEGALVRARFFLTTGGKEEAPRALSDVGDGELSKRDVHPWRCFFLEY